eukprot:GFKZ01007621.1.p1 GENE.GFKZ01007621.1~~GFKZ01007621.1.p1  ORF type:complete len:106 (+),score=3.79 GFKZ01007621.1:107-424(+)
MVRSSFGGRQNALENEAFPETGRATALMGLKKNEVWNCTNSTSPVIRERSPAIGHRIGFPSKPIPHSQQSLSRATDTYAPMNLRGTSNSTARHITNCRQLFSSCV